VGKAIESVLQQSFQDFEIIVIDDASRDATWDVISDYDDPRIRTFRHETNRGAHNTLNEGIALARGDYIAVLNSDDVYYPERLARAKDCLDRNPALAACFTHYDFIDHEGKVSRHADAIQPESAFLPDPGFPVGDESSHTDRQVIRLLCGNYLHTTSNLVGRRAAIERVGPFRSYRYVHDHDFFLRLCHAYPIEWMQDCLLGYRFHETNTLAENAVASVTETAAMLADFLLTHELAFLQGPLQETIVNHLLKHFNAYGADRLVLLLLLSGRWQRLPSHSDSTINIDPKKFGSLSPGMAQFIQAGRAEGQLLWQESQTTKWWQEAGRLSDQLQFAQQELWDTKQELWDTQQELWRLQQESTWWHTKYSQTYDAKLRSLSKTLLAPFMKTKGD
jgi:glycosyltransferase involved in cell wall biosynthesis